MHRFTRHRLKNGLAVGVLAAPRFKRALAQVWFRAGSRFESAATSGCSHLLEHVLFRGSERYPTRLALERALHDVRADHNAFTEQEWVSIYLEVPVANIHRAVDLLGEIAFRPRLIDIEIEQRIVDAEIREANLADGLIDQRIGRLLWGTHPLGFPIAGRRSPRTNRRSLRALHRRHFRPANGTLLVAGAVTPASILATARRTVRDIDPGEPRLPPAPPLGHGARVQFGRGTGKETRILLHFRIDRAVDEWDRFTLELLSSLLWERLNRTLREERGVCYDLDVGVDFGYELNAFAVYVVVKKSAAAAAVREVFTQLADVLRGAGAAADLARVQANYNRDFALLEDDIDELADHYAGQLLVHRPVDVRTPTDAIRFVERTDLDRIGRTGARLLDPESVTLLLLGAWSGGDRVKWRSRFERHLNDLRRVAEPAR